MFWLATVFPGLNVLPMPRDVPQLLRAMNSGDPKVAEELLPLVNDELRRLAAHKMAGERAGHPSAHPRRQRLGPVWA